MNLSDNMNQSQINYHKEFLKTIAQIERRGLTPTLLLHSCCAPCSSAAISRLLPYFKISVLYYNPNIYPASEYQLRKQEQQRLIAKLQPYAPFPIQLIDCDWEGDQFAQQVAAGLEQEPEGGRRCLRCFELRLACTAQRAQQLQYDFFATTLTVSPYKNAALLNALGLRLAQQFQVRYLVADFKKAEGYKLSIQLSKQYQLYRQNYCGCRYSYLAAQQRYNGISDKTTDQNSNRIGKQ